MTWEMRLFYIGLLFHMGEGASACLQIVLLPLGIQQNHKIWLLFLKFNEEQDFKYEEPNFQPESRDMTIIL